jgi:hypothetical protein
MGKVCGQQDPEFPAYFLATRLLPCGLFEHMKKFTGNDDVCDAHDDLSKAIHTFAHFSLQYTHGHLVLCDLQGVPNDLIAFQTDCFVGLFDRNKVMHLVDPQCHMCVQHEVHIHLSNVLFRLPEYAPFKIYWDLGGTGIDAFKRAHKTGCLENEFCARFGFQDGKKVNLTAPNRRASGPLRHGKYPVSLASVHVQMNYQVSPKTLTNVFDLRDVLTFPLNENLI